MIKHTKNWWKIWVRGILVLAIPLVTMYGLAVILHAWIGVEATKMLFGMVGFGVVLIGIEYLIAKAIMDD